MELISIHIPKAAGTSFYKILKAIYEDKMFPIVRRRDIEDLVKYANNIGQSPLNHYLAIHGHFRFLEIQPIYRHYQSKLITWLRHPVDRVISNYHFFNSRLEKPDYNPVVYENNKHRITETLLEYAELSENRNRMSWFLEGIPLENLDFIGIVEYFEVDFELFLGLMGWKFSGVIPRLNQNTQKKITPSKEIIRKIEAWNEIDMALYEKAMQMRIRS